jgi:uncharacterized protein with HEPN domain
MQPDLAKFLHDMRQAIDSMLEFVDGKTMEEYVGDKMLRAAVERQLEILGEAMTWIARTYPDTAAAIPESREIIGLRNILIHQYFRVDNNVVWDIVETNIADLRKVIDTLLREAAG